MAETWLGEYFSPEASTQASPLSALTILKGTRFLSLATTPSSKRRPIRRLTANSVPSGLVTAWRLAGWPTRRSPSLEKATIEGVVRAPSAFSMTLGLLPSITATQLLVVPRSIPMTLAIIQASLSANPFEPPLARQIRGRMGPGSLQLKCAHRWTCGVYRSVGLWLQALASPKSGGAVRAGTAPRSRCDSGQS